MVVSHDELAGVVDLFGALTPGELEEALSELAFRRGADPPDADRAIEDALREYALVGVEGDDERLLAAGPTAFPTLPDGAADLPHIMDADSRDVDRETLARAAEERFRADAADAVERGDEGRIAHLVDVSYELESWGSASLDGVRERLDAVGESRAN